MADQHYSNLCLLGVMDHLWFHHIVLFPAEATSVLDPRTLKPSQHTSDDSLAGHSESLFLSPSSHGAVSSPSSEDKEKSSDSSPVAPLDDSNTETEKKEMDTKERPTRSNLMGAGRARSYSSSPTTQKRPKSLRDSGSNMSKLQKSKSCRSLWDLELEEVKGFMDLGFVFEKEHLNPRVMSVVPGLQRVTSYKNKNKQKTETDTHAAEIAKEDKVLEQEEYDRCIMRPYLSEAWLIKRPDSPLLNLRMPRMTAPADMKKHLRFWAKTVASAIQQEC